MNDLYAVLIDWMQFCGGLAIFVGLVSLGFNWMFKAFLGHNPF